jgi:hypothetical protein
LPSTKNPDCPWTVRVDFGFLSGNERQKGHMPSALYSFGKLALVLGTDTGMFRIDYFRLARNKPSN